MLGLAPVTNPPPAPNRRRFRWPKIPKWVDTVFVVAGAALLVYVVSRYPLGEVAAACRKLGPLVGLVFLLPLVWHASGAGAVYVLLERRIAWRKIFWVRIAADAYNSLFLSVGGEPFRVRFLSRFVPADQVVAALIRDRVLDMTSGYLVSATFLFIGLGRYTLTPVLSAGLYLYAAVTMALGLAGMVLVTTRLPSRFGALIFRVVGGSSTTPPATLPTKTLLTVLPFYLVSRAIGVLEIGVLIRLLAGRMVVTEAGFFDGVLNAAGALSFFLPGALGVFEGTSVYLFGVLGLGGPQGVVFGLVRRARMILFSAAGVVLHWLGRNAMAAAEKTSTPDRWRTLRRYGYTLLRAPRGIGRPQPASQWDGEYSDGKWRKLDSAVQLGHYALIDGYVSHFFPAKPKILDVGCGHGRLFQLLRRSGYREYLGHDLSAEAIRQAAAEAPENARFEVADFTSWTSCERFDVIIFNESIYYAPDPLQQLERYTSLLNEGGLIVLSIVQSSMNRGIARRIRRKFDVLHSSLVRNECGESWEVSVVRGRR